MVLHSRPITKSAAAAMASPQPTSRPAATTKASTPPRVLQSGHAPAQLCFFFKRG
jgi:hypothetical protein